MIGTFDPEGSVGAEEVRISGISRAYLAGASLAHLAGISRAYLGHTSVISRAYLGEYLVAGSVPAGPLLRELHEGARRAGTAATTKLGLITTKRGPITTKLGLNGHQTWPKLPPNLA